MWAITGACCANTALQRRECLELARGALCWHDVVLYSHHNGTILDLGNKQPQIRSNIQEVHQENLGEEKKTAKRTRYVNPARIERTTLRTSQTGISRATTVPRVLTTKCHRGRDSLALPLPRGSGNTVSTPETQCTLVANFTRRIGLGAFPASHWHSGPIMSYSPSKIARHFRIAFPWMNIR